MATSRRLSVVMFTDIVGFTAATQADEPAALGRRQEEEEIVQRLSTEYGGRVVKSLGDGQLLEFESALKATQCAIEILRRIQERNSLASVVPIELRIGLHAGDVEHQGSDIFGDTVNVASRVVPLANPGGICLSGQVADLVRNKLSFPVEPMGPQSLKGVSEPVELFRLTLPNAIKAAPVGARSPPRLAVLPLANISPDPGDEYLADGLTEELISVLSQIRELRVIARTSVAQFKSTTRSIAQIGAELGVDSVLEGSVRKAGNRIRITLQLIDVPTQEHVWANSFNRELDDVFSIQSEVAEQTAAALRLKLRSNVREAIQRGPTSDLGAYDLYLRGVYASRQNTLEGLRSATRYFEGATQKDPRFATAYAHWANLYVMSLGEFLPIREAAPRAKELVATALQLDPNSSDAHTTQGNIALQCDQDWTLAEAEFRQAIALNPSEVSAYHWYGVLLFTLQRFEEARTVLEKAHELDPYWKSSMGWLVLVHLLSGDAPRALELAQQASAQSPVHRLDRVRLALVLARLGRMAEAVREVESMECRPTESAGVYRAIVLALAGQPEAARAAVGAIEAGDRGDYVSLSRLAALHSVLGETEAAFTLLERDLREGDRTFWFEYQIAGFDSLRGDPRFAELLRRYHLPAKPSHPASRG